MTAPDAALPEGGGADDPPSKTLATWIAVIGGAFGLHHFYLGGLRRWVGWLYPLPTLAGLLGVYRMRTVGLDDALSALLVPWLGVTLTAGMLCAIVIGLTPDAAWARRYAGGSAPGTPQPAPPPSPGAADDEGEPPGFVATAWGPVLGVIVALLLGGTVLMGTIAFSVQKYFESARP